MVPRPDRSPGGVSDQITSEGGCDQTTSQQTASVPVPSKVDCMKQYDTEGFSAAVAERAVGARRSSTYQTYNARLTKCSRWASWRGFDPLLATVAQIADFMEYLFAEKHLQVRTIQGYRSPISLIHTGWDGIKVGNHPRLEKLLKAYFNSRPPQRKLSPSWSVTLMLNSLMKAPFEPLD